MVPSNVRAVRRKWSAWLGWAVSCSRTSCSTQKRRPKKLAFSSSETTTHCLFQCLILLVVGALQACLETLNSGLGAVLLFLEVLVALEGGGVGGWKMALDDSGDGLSVGGLCEE